MYGAGVVVVGIAFLALLAHAQPQLQLLTNYSHATCLSQSALVYSFSIQTQSCVSVTCSNSSQTKCSTAAINPFSLMAPATYGVQALFAQPAQCTAYSAAPTIAPSVYHSLQLFPAGKSGGCSNGLFKGTITLQCDGSCASCTFAQNPSSCTSCVNGLTPVAGVCSQTCDSTCATCYNADDPTACLSCSNPGATLTYGQCELIQNVYTGNWIANGPLTASTAVSQSKNCLIYTPTQLKSGYIANGYCCATVGVLSGEFCALNFCNGPVDRMNFILDTDGVRCVSSCYAQGTFNNTAETIQRYNGAVLTDIQPYVAVSETRSLFVYYGVGYEVFVSEGSSVVSYACLLSGTYPSRIGSQPSQCDYSCGSKGKAFPYFLYDTTTNVCYVQCTAQS